jgi:glutathione S-transferase
MAAMRDSGRFGKVFELVEAVENLPNVKAYLASDRRQKFGAGIYRDYPDLDVLPTSTRSRADDIKEYEKMVE